MIFLLQWLGLVEGRLSRLLMHWQHSTHRDGVAFRVELRRLITACRGQLREIEEGSGMNSRPFSIRELSLLYKDLETMNHNENWEWSEESEDEDGQHSEESEEDEDGPPPKRRRRHVYYMA